MTLLIRCGRIDDHPPHDWHRRTWSRVHTHHCPGRVVVAGGERPKEEQ
jgi:hypothetical protein